MPRITVLPQTVNPLTRLTALEVVKRKVAGYARVSTDLEEQITSYQAQRKYYTEYIQKNPDWELQECIRMRAFLLHLPGIEND